MPSPKRGGASRPRLTRERITDAALRIIDTEGREALSMRRLGQALDCEAMTLYRYVRNKRDLLSGVVDRLFLEWDVPDPIQRDWRHRVHEGMESYAQMALRHPRAFPLLSDLSLFATEAMHRSERMYAVVSAGGFDARATLLAVVTLGSYADGFLLTQIGSVDKKGQDVEGEARHDSCETPLIAAAARYKAFVNSQEGFHAAIDVILDGLVRREGWTRSRRKR
jgi:AcrR family transcriptional regulator